MRRRRRPHSTRLPHPLPTALRPRAHLQAAAMQAGTTPLSSGLGTTYAFDDGPYWTGGKGGARRGVCARGGRRHWPLGLSACVPSRCPLKRSPSPGRPGRPSVEQAARVRGRRPTRAMASPATAQSAPEGRGETRPPRIKNGLMVPIYLSVFIIPAPNDLLCCASPTKCFPPGTQWATQPQPAPRHIQVPEANVAYDPLRRRCWRARARACVPCLRAPPARHASRGPAAARPPGLGRLLAAVARSSTLPANGASACASLGARTARASPVVAVAPLSRRGGCPTRAHYYVLICP